MNLSIRFVPLTCWPSSSRTNPQKVSRFDSSYNATLELLETELHVINARNVVIQAFFRPDQMRGDGWPLASAEPSDSGVVLSFDTYNWNAVKRANDINSLSFPCDTYTTFDDNLRAIALTLEALRRIARYGVTRNDQQYTGWKALPSAGVDSDAEMTPEQAREFIRQMAGYYSPNFNGDWSGAYRMAARKLHPDAKTGNHELFVKLQRAREVLGL